MDPVLLKCRVCLADGADNKMYDIFTVCTEQKNNDGFIELEQLLLYEKIEVCCGVKIPPVENMPTKICEDCFSMTRMLYEFRQQCINTQEYLERRQTNELSANDSNDDPPKSVESSENPDEIVDDTQSIKEEPQDISEDEDNSVFDDSETDFLDDSDAADWTGNVKKKKTVNLKTKTKSPPKKAPKTYMCNICANVYKNKAMFTYHMNQHSNARPHECEICSKTFRQLSDLRAHLRRHTGERPFKCAYCDRHFIDRGGRRRHERVHTNSRPYECTVCGKSFTYSASLKNHQKIHTGEKTFSCTVCDKSFSLPHQYKAHLQTLTHRHKEEQSAANSKAVDQESIQN